MWRSGCEVSVRFHCRKSFTATCAVLSALVEVSRRSLRRLALGRLCLVVGEGRLQSSTELFEDLFKVKGPQWVAST